MKKSGLILLIMALFLVTTSVSAGGLDPSKPMLTAGIAEMGILETKIDVWEEVIGAYLAGEIDVALSAYSPQSIELSINAVNDLCLLVERINKVRASFSMFAGGVAVRLKYPHRTPNSN